ncbi:hypothetical protein PybrP1_010369 [[Pythium] brassicae (nom. inval.)]|nr:hypothetical protein PybrP1_010369 [[Pythium] brassicae (nom. inval.)]
MGPGVLLPLLALLSAAVSAALLLDLWRANALPSQCEMTYSWPVYTPLPAWLKTSSPPKYELASVHMRERRTQLTGVPLLFLPGHLGSHKQARSLARHLADRGADEQLFDVFAVDFGGELSGLSGDLVRQQARFVNDAVRAILRQYRKQHKKLGKKAAKTRKGPESVVVVAHSMGGVVARLAATLPNYAPNSIRHVVSLGTPYERPPFPFDAEMQHVYAEIAHRLDDASDDTADDAADDATAPVYISIAGGHKDLIVHTPLSAVDRVAHPARSLALLTTAMPSVGLTMDHLCLLWCHQLLDRVAQSIVAVVDAEKRELLPSASLRLATARDVLLAGGADADADAAVNATTALLHREYVRSGYHALEFASYGLLTPQPLFHLLRSSVSTVVLVMYALALHILSLQVAHWQAAFNFQSASSGVPPPPPTQRKFPSFTSMLHPSAHVPTFLKSVVALVTGSNDSKRTAIAVMVVVSAAVIGAVRLAVEAGRRDPAFAATYGVVLELAVLYAYALGLLYGVSVLLSAVRSLVVSPVVAVLTTRFKHTPRWMIIGAIYALVFAAGHVERVAPFTLVASLDASRSVVLLALASFAVFVLYLVSLGGNALTSADQQSVQRSLFAVFALSLVPWTGKLLFFIDVVRFPPPALSTALLAQSALCVVVLSLARYLATLSQEQMLPMPPAAFFGAATGQDAGSAYDAEKRSTAGSAKVTAETCPKCVFEDGGPGAILVEYTDATTIRLGPRDDVVLVGPSFRVVACDCVFRFTSPREFCGFCTRACRLCGGGAGSVMQAHKYSEFAAATQREAATHALVPLLLELLAVAQLSVGLGREHWMGYLTPLCTAALLVYHVALLSSVEATRRRNKLSKGKKKKRKSKAKTSTGSGAAPSKAAPPAAPAGTKSTTTTKTTTTTTTTKQPTTQVPGTSSNAKTTGSAKTNAKRGRAPNPNVPESLFVNPIYEMVDADE